MINRNSLNWEFSIVVSTHGNMWIGHVDREIPFLRLSVYYVLGLVPTHDEVSSVRRAFGGCLGTKRR